MYFSNSFRITLIFTSNLPISCIIKWLLQPLRLSNITGIFLVNLRLILQSQSLVSSSTNNPAFVIWFKASFILYSHDKIFIKVLFYHLFTIPILLKNHFNKLVDCLFSSVKNNWLVKSIVKTYNFVSKTARNMSLVFFSLRTITTSMIIPNPF